MKFAVWWVIKNDFLWPSLSGLRHLLRTAGSSLGVSPYPTLRELIKENGNTSGERETLRVHRKCAAYSNSEWGKPPHLLQCGEFAQRTGSGTSLRVQHLLMGEMPNTAMLHRNAVAPQDRAASPQRSGLPSPHPPISPIPVKTNGTNH